MIIQPFLENEIIHAFKTRDTGELKMRMSINDDYLICEIDDNGIGREAPSMLSIDNNRESLAIKITEKRLSIINKQRGTNATYQIIDRNMLGAIMSRWYSETIREK
jgi:sensor histidine kinase YesM